MLKHISQDPKERELYESRRKAMLDEQDRMEGAFEKGVEVGIERGIEKGIEKGIEEGSYKNQIKTA